MFFNVMMKIYGNDCLKFFNYDGDNLFLCAPGTLFLRFLGTEDPFVLMNVSKWRNFLKNNLSQKNIMAKLSSIYIMVCLKNFGRYGMEKI